MGDRAFSRLNIVAKSAERYAAYFYEQTSVFDAHISRDDVPHIVISFTPREYGKEYVGLLIVEADDIQWTYEVHGTYPPYKPPDKSQMRPKVITDSKQNSPSAKSVRQTPKRGASRGSSPRSSNFNTPSKTYLL